MEQNTELSARLKQLLEERSSLEKDSQSSADLSDRKRVDLERGYDKLQRSLLALFRESKEEKDRIQVMFELVRLLENRLVNVQNFSVDPTSDTRALAAAVTKLLDQLGATRAGLMTSLELIYYRAILALFAGDLGGARSGFQAACQSEESDEANDIKFKSYVILGNLSHEEQDYQTARQFHDESIRYSHHGNVTAQALAFKALNSYALNERDEALALFEESLRLFQPEQPFFNSYFYRNALLFCGLIQYERKNMEKAREYYEKVVAYVEADSYDHFDALARLGKIHYAAQRFPEAAAAFGQAIDTHKCSENEYLVDTWFWLARTHLRQNKPQEARPFLEKIVSSEVKYDKRDQVAELLRKVS
ncbi:MAG TPA: tetratricopeptide repeat protein [Thermoanaerobaculia bacterium]|nr:tetratricopeptide repeat protein [Thermoanaerobaculia bacterium]